MKKIFSLVALAGMFALMSFSFKTEKVEEEQVPWCDTVGNVCLDEAWNTIKVHGYSEDEASAWYYSCTSINGCN